MADINQIFISSLDNPDGWEIKNYTLSKDVEIDTTVNYHEFDSGAPVLKYFTRDPQYDTLIFKAGDQISVVVNNNEEEAYLYINNAWNEIMCWDENYIKCKEYNKLL